MLAVKRLEEITRLLSERGSVDAAWLSNQFGVTAKTIRKDLDQLESMGLLERVHGGAVIRSNANNVYPIEQRKLKYLDEKRRIGMAAFEFVEEGDTLIIDGGSTTIELARLLGDKKIIAVVDDLRIAVELMNKPAVTLFMPGGKLRREGSYTFLGRDAERAIEKYKVKKLFLGTSAFDFQAGLSVLNSDEAEVKKAMISVAQEIICLTDYSKFHHIAFATFCPIDRINTLITDDRMPESEKDFLSQKGIQVHTV
jgi:DeoR/GlpR family transcriptional regulator of sugar metabolism